jgi:hypothetical protein
MQGCAEDHEGVSEKLKVEEPPVAQTYVEEGNSGDDRNRIPHQRGYSRRHKCIASLEAVLQRDRPRHVPGRAGLATAVACIGPPLRGVSAPDACGRRCRRSRGFSGMAARRASMIALGGLFQFGQRTELAQSPQSSPLEGVHAPERDIQAAAVCSAVRSSSEMP